MIPDSIEVAKGKIDAALAGLTNPVQAGVLIVMLVERLATPIEYAVAIRAITEYYWEDDDNGK